MAAALGRMTVHGIDDKQLMLELEFYLAVICLASLTCLQQGTAAMGAGQGVLWEAVSLCSLCLHSLRGCPGSWRTPLG